MKKRKQGASGSWMDTYGDMVTLLLCFFVLLYSMSTLDQQKWLQLVQSFNPDSIQEMTENSGNNGQFTDPITGSVAEGFAMTQAEVEAALDLLYEELTEYTVSQGAQHNVSVTRGEGYVFISFNDAVFFSGDSYTLLDSGKAVLDDMAVILGKAGDSIDELRVLGHTAQSSPDAPNNPSKDRFLAASRATEVLVYLQEKDILDPARMISVGYGQWRPVASNEDAEGRAKNRRVEMIVTGMNVADPEGGGIAQYYSERDAGQGTAGGTVTPAPVQP